MAERWILGLISCMGFVVHILHVVGAGRPCLPPSYPSHTIIIFRISIGLYTPSRNTKRNTFLLFNLEVFLGPTISPLTTKHDTKTRTMIISRSYSHGRDQEGRIEAVPQTHCSHHIHCSRFLSISQSSSSSQHRARFLHSLSCLLSSQIPLNSYILRSVPTLTSFPLSLTARFNSIGTD